MIAVIQRVTEAGVRVGEETAAAIGPGLAALVAVLRDDAPADVQVQHADYAAVQYAIRRTPQAAADLHCEDSIQPS